MKKSALLIIGLVFFPLYVFAGCPSMNCPDNRETPIAVYHFENNFYDSSGHGLTAGNNYDPAPVQFYPGIGGRPGYCVGNFVEGTMTGVTINACAIYRSEGEIEWYQYITGATATNSVFCNWNNGSQFLYMEMGNSYTGPDMANISYSYWDGVGDSSNYFVSECLKYNTWQHFSFQWGGFGTRVVVDGNTILGSASLWDQGTTMNDVIIRFGTNGTTLGFLGYLDDITIWPCSGHGTPTVTPTHTATKTHTNTPTYTISPTFSITETPSVSPTVTETPIPPLTFTVTLSATITPTPSISPTPAAFRLIGVFPNPAGKTARLIFTSDSDCGAAVSIYTVSGEKINTLSYDAGAGMNEIDIQSKNFRYSNLSSGVYIYSLELQYAGGRKKVVWGKYTVIK